MNAKKYLKVKMSERVITTRPIEFYCIACHNVVTEERFPGPTPKYCSDCLPEVKREQARERKRWQRARGTGSGSPPAELARQQASLNKFFEATQTSRKLLEQSVDVVRVIDWLRAQGRNEEAEELTSILNKESVRKALDRARDILWADLTEQD